MGIIIIVEAEQPRVPDGSGRRRGKARPDQQRGTGLILAYLIYKIYNCRMPSKAGRLLTSCDALNAAGDRRLGTFLQRSAAILIVSARRVQQEEWQKSFLENMPANRCLLVEAFEESSKGSG